jgi:murein DD-endopeptidase MepM/ murein hydrolase activator NlpD
MNRNRRLTGLTRLRDLREGRDWMRHLAAGLIAVLLCVIGIAALTREASSRLRHAFAEAAPLTPAGGPFVSAPSVGAPAGESGRQTAQDVPAALVATPRPAVTRQDEDRTDTSTIAIARDLRGRRLTLPVEGVAAADLVSSFDQGRSDHRHEALDILAPRGTRVLAVEDGVIAKLFWSVAGGRTIYQFDPSGRVAYYYAHLDGYADGLTEGRAVRRGDTLGFVGSSGNADAAAPHLHFAIFALTPERQWWKGTAIDPFPILRWSIDTPP